MRAIEEMLRETQALRFAFALKRRIEFEADVEVVFHGAFAAAGHNDDVLDAGGKCFFHPVLQDGLVDQGKHLLGNDFCGRQKARAQAAGGKDCFTYFLIHWFFLFLVGAHASSCELSKAPVNRHD
jgi:hypothetical protein